MSKWGKTEQYYNYTNICSKYDYLQVYNVADKHLKNKDRKVTDKHILMRFMFMMLTKHSIYEVLLNGKWLAFRLQNILIIKSINHFIKHLFTL